MKCNQQIGCNRSDCGEGLARQCKGGQNQHQLNNVPYYIQDIQRKLENIDNKLDKIIASMREE